MRRPEKRFSNKETGKTSQLRKLSSNHSRITRNERQTPNGSKRIHEGKIMRTDEVYRKTRETEVTVKVNLDGEGKIKAGTGVSFFDHLITSFATHSLIDLTAKVKGDLKHHAIEDLAIGLGEALNKALGNREGITRFGYAAVPMDDALAFAAVDLVKRPYAVIDLKLRVRKLKIWQLKI